MPITLRYSSNVRVSCSIELLTSSKCVFESRCSFSCKALCFSIAFTCASNLVFFNSGSEIINISFRRYPLICLYYSGFTAPQLAFIHLPLISARSFTGLPCAVPVKLVCPVKASGVVMVPAAVPLPFKSALSHTKSTL